MALSDFLAYVKSSIPFSLSETPHDFTDSFEGSAPTRPAGALMPPGPGVVTYSEAHEMTPEGLNYALHVEWEPWVKKWLVPSIEPWQVTHRSRLLAVSANQLKVNELRHRIAQTAEFAPSLEKVALKPSVSAEAFQIVAETTKRYMHTDLDWIGHYIKEHVNSSLGAGHKWRQGYEVTKAEWEEVRQMMLANLENMETHIGMYSNISWYSGIRARSSELKSVSDLYGNPTLMNHGQLTPKWYETMNRSRIILFHPAMSLWTVFISQKAAWYTEVLNKFINLIKPQGEYFFPYVLGGQVYIKAQQLFNSEEKFVANDGKSWESSQGILLGDAFRPFMVDFGGYPMLPSGETFTSMFGTMASIIATRNYPGTWIILGDDMNHWGGPRITVPYIEEQPLDTKYKWILGVASAKRKDGGGIDRPAISGIKMSMDRAGAMVGIRTEDYVVHQSVQFRRRDPRIRGAWAGLFHGWFGPGTLIDAISGVPPGEFISPGEYIENLVEDQSSEIDPYEWAEREGIKNLFIR